MSIRCNQGILHRNHENNAKRKAIKAPNRSIIAVVETSKPRNKLKIDNSINPRLTECMAEVTEVKELESFSTSSGDINMALKIGKELSEPMKGLLKKFLIKNLDVFSWKHANMVDIDPKVAWNALKIDHKIKLKI